MAKKKVVVGMSGGVDSSVAAYLLKESGYDVIGATMRIWKDAGPQDREREGGCCGLDAVDDARRAAQRIGIPYYVMNFKDEFYDKVIRYFINEYRMGNTPNPCIACNKYLKWGALLRRAVEIGADYIATGHYAKIVKLENGRYSVGKSAAGKKDQTYVLFNLDQRQLERTLMPLGEYSKDEVREIARKAGLETADKSDSQDICFVPDRDYAGFIEKETGEECRPGSFIDEDGKVIGTHRGIERYTIGQRRGLNLPAKSPYYVKSINPKTREITLGGEKSAFRDVIYVKDVNYMAVEEMKGPERLYVKIRYSHEGAECLAVPLGDGALECRFYEKQRAPAPGQAAVFYRDGYVYAGGWIENRGLGQ